MSQINKQINTIHEMFELVAEKRKTARTIRISIAATIISLISIASSIAGLISTIDYSNNIPSSARLYFTFAGMLGAVALYLLALFPWQRIFTGRNLR